MSDSFVDFASDRLLRSDSDGPIHKHVVCVYVHNCLLIDCITAHRPSILSFYLVASKVYIMVIFRTPFTSLQNKELADLIAEFCQRKEVILMGDLNLPNLPSIDWCGGGGGGIDLCGCPSS